MSKDTKLIILRGNSGSGKSTTAKALQKKFGHGTMMISQDMVRREILWVKERLGTRAIPLFLDLIKYGKQNCEVVILEGIFNAKCYKDLFETLKIEFENRIYAYYFDVPFEETLIRHSQRHLSQEFGEDKMRSWWKEKDYLDMISEKNITKELSLEQIVDLIYFDVINK